MATEFIGSTVLVTLKSPPNAKVQGTVAGIVEQQLTLRSVFWLASGHQSLSFPIEGTNIADLEVLSDATEPEDGQGNGDLTDHPKIPSAKSEGNSLDFPDPGVTPQTTSKPFLERPLQSFSDPAILSYGKRPIKPQHGPSQARPNDPRPSIPQEMLAEAVEDGTLRTTPNILGTSTIPNIMLSEPTHLSFGAMVRTESIATATLSGPFDEHPRNEGLGIVGQSRIEGMHGAKGETEAVHSEKFLEERVDASVRYTGRRRRRGGKGAGIESGSNKPLRDQRELNQMRHLDSSPVARKKHRTRPTRTSEAQNGWATEEATDIQEMGDFDFEANLSKFDKREVFNQIKHDDTTADEDRLVSHNRLPARPGTAGCKNLHFTENVLDTPKTDGIVKWNSEAGDSAGDISDSKLSSGRSSRRTASRAAVRKPPSRKSSVMVSDIPRRSGSGVLNDSLGKAHYSSYERSGSPKTKSKLMSSPYSGSQSAIRPTFRISESNKVCPCLTPLQMLEFEQLAVSELGLSEDMMSENAARGIAETVLVATQRSKRGLGNGNLKPTSVIILAGNNKSGARAIAGGRHLQNHGAQVFTSVLGLEREGDLHDNVRQQIQAYSKCGAILLKGNEMLGNLKGGRLKPRIVVDALLGMHISFDDLRRDDQAVCFELVRWINRNDIEVLSIDVPSGVDASSGELTVIDEKSLVFISSFILSLGAPKTGLLAMLRDSSENTSVQIFVADIGISNTTWKRFGNRRKSGIDFSSEWVISLQYHGGDK